MYSVRPAFVLAILMPYVLLASAAGQENSAAVERRQAAREFHQRSIERTGVLVPMYVYPANIHTNPAYNRLIELKRRHETLPFWVIVNPASGPGQQVDANYTKAIDRLRGAGCVVLGYVATSYGKKPAVEVRREIDGWLERYPRIQGIFFDEMVYEDNDAAAQYQAALNRYAHEIGCWPTVGNPGTDTPGRYFYSAADVIIVHEGDKWPTEERLKGDYFGGYSDYPPFTRAILLHSQPTLDLAAVRMARKYCRWMYVTEGLYRAGDPQAANPWDRLAKHLDELCDCLENTKSNK